MRYLVVKNFHKFQHDTTKSLPWIKFFTALLAPTKEPWYSELPDATKALLHHLWLMARVFNNKIPEGWLTRERLNVKSRVNLDSLIDCGCIWFVDESGKILSPSRARDARSGVSNSDLSGSTGGEPERGFDAEAAFEPLWAEYPKPIGRKAALKHFTATVKSLDDVERCRTALQAYKASDTVARGFVQNGATWFNQWQDWTPKAPTAPTPEDLRQAAVDALRDWALDRKSALRRDAWPFEDCTREEFEAWAAWSKGELVWGDQVNTIERWRETTRVDA
jgi:hypothetical protein